MGRQRIFPHGIEILTAADYFTLGSMMNAYLNIRYGLTTSLRNNYGPARVGARGDWKEREKIFMKSVELFFFENGDTLGFMYNISYLVSRWQCSLSTPDLSSITWSNPNFTTGTGTKVTSDTNSEGINHTPPPPPPPPHSAVREMAAKALHNLTPLDSPYTRDNSKWCRSIIESKRAQQHNREHNGNSCHAFSISLA